VSEATKILHLSLIRCCKGIIRAWEKWVESHGVKIE
jgi:hypothetical protein